MDDGIFMFVLSNIGCFVPVILIILGLVVGGSVESAHLRSLERRERELLTIPISDVRSVPDGMDATQGELVTGAVVIGADYFKTFAAGLRNLIGGEVRSYERLMARARREAICRMLDEAHSRGATAVINLRLETSNIGAIRRNPTPMVEILAYGTAVIP